MKRTASIENIFRPLSDAPLQSALSNEVQIADILEWVLQQVGTAEVWQTSFSISEEFLRRLYFITRNGSASAIHLVLDFKATNKTLSLWTFIEQVISSTHLADNHSKVLLIHSLKRALKNYRYFHFIGVVRRHYRAFTRRSGYDVW